MSKKPSFAIADRRSRLDLQLFVLAMIEIGLRTPYALQAEAGLSPGATIPVLARLLAAGYVERSAPGSRGRAEYKVTRLGRGFLRDSRDSLQIDSEADLESILRAATLALVSGVTGKSVAERLLSAAGGKAESAEKLSAAPQTPAGSSPPEIYRWMRSTYLKTRLQADVRVLKHLASELKAVSLDIPPLR
jgi:DNA-binding PadR family transcriptional regulator